jgi:hypothetical protein
VGLTKAPVAVSPPHRGASFSGFVFRGDGRQAFEPAAQVVRQDECGLAALQRTEFAVLNRIVKARPADARDRACLVDLECNRVGLHRSCTVRPGSARQPRPYNASDGGKDANIQKFGEKDKCRLVPAGVLS